MKNVSMNEADNSTNAATASRSHLIGRPPHRFTIILRDFTRSNGIVADKENFYIFMVRAVIKSIKFTLKNKILKPVGFTLNIPKPELQKIRSESKFHLIGYNFKLDEQEKKNFYKMNFIRDYFRDFRHQNIFSIITDLMLLDQNFSVLCKRFNIFCCRRESHSELCEAKWSAFKVYLRTDFIHDLVEAKDEEKIFGVLDLD